MTVLTKEARRLKRRRRVRAKIVGTAERPRISVFRSNRGVSVQLVDDLNGRTLAAVQWTEFRDTAKSEQAAQVGKALAERARAAGVERAVFDRGGYQYHGRVKALAEAARAGGPAFSAQEPRCPSRPSIAPSAPPDSTSRSASSRSTASPRSSRAAGASR